MNRDGGLAGVGGVLEGSCSFHVLTSLFLLESSG